MLRYETSTGGVEGGREGGMAKINVFTDAPIDDWTHMILCFNFLTFLMIYFEFYVFYGR